MDKIYWIAIIYFVVSAIGSWASRRKKTARETARREQSRRTVSEGEPEPEGSMRLNPEPEGSMRLNPEPEGSMRLNPEPDPEPQPPRHRQTPDEIAAEIRRVMGLERQESRVEVIEEVYEEPVISARSHIFESEEELTHGGSLHDRLEARAAGGHHGQGKLETRPLAAMGSHRLGRLADRFAPAQKAAATARRRSRLIDISVLTRAFVTMEVLGPPKALRDDF